MEWTLFALLQMFIITVGVSLACWLRMRGAQRQNLQLRQHIDSLDVPDEGAVAPDTWVNERIDQLPADDPAAPLIKLVLQHSLQATPDFADKLGETLHQAGLGGGGDADSDERIAQLEEELSAAKAAVDAMPEDSDGERAEELKTLLQQFTKDSREMMACIQSLEAENAQLREQLGEPPPGETSAGGTEEASAASETEAGTEDAA